MRSVKGIFLVALLLAVGLVYSLGNVPTAAAATVVGCGTSSSADGEQMILTGNLVCAGPIAVTIQHNKVHLDMQGFTITGPEPEPADADVDIGILLINAINPTNAICVPRPGPSDVHINGGTVENFDHGIFLCRTTKAHINGMTSRNNDLTGIRLSSSDNNNRINGSTLSGNGSGGGQDGGLTTVFSDGNVIHTMDIRENNPDGVHFLASGGNKITSSEIIDNNRVGVFLDRSGSNTVQGNNIQGNSQGINVSAGGGSDTIRGNTINNNGSGILWRFAPNGLVRSNTVNNNGNRGISLTRTTGLLVQSNTALGNGLDVFDNNFFAVPSPCNNTWKNNLFVTEFDPAGCVQ